MADKVLEAYENKLGKVKETYKLKTYKVKQGGEYMQVEQVTLQGQKKRWKTGDD